MRIEERHGKFVVSDFDEFEAYRIACTIERDGIRFYGLLAKNTKDQKITQTLDFLLGEEKKHLVFFEGNLNALRVATEDRHEDNDLLGSMDFGVFKPYQDMSDLNNIVTDSKKALALSVAVEDMSIRFYQGCYAAISSTAVKTQLKRIIEEEEKHKKLFEELLRSR
ncbi:MAG: ferritin-like domain-containing protein [Candidatus Omnitrophica bacterium]|nr:ferritin-like domain-containing protein [Candidatus Omnitrophota bacterium]